MSQQINFVDPSLLPPARQVSGLAVAAVLVAGVVAVGVHYAYERMELAHLLAEAAALDATKSNVDDAATAAQNDALITAREQELARKEALRNALADWSDLPTGIPAKIAGVIASMPATVWLKDIEFSGRDGLRIAGGATDSTALVAYTSRLGGVEGLKGAPVLLVTLEHRTPEKASADGAGDAGQHREELPPHYQFVLSSNATDSGDTP